MNRAFFNLVSSTSAKVSSIKIRVSSVCRPTTLKDVEGKEFGKEIIALAKSQGSGWVEYRMTNPVTKKVGLKRSWVIGLGDYILFVGAFGS